MIRKSADISRILPTLFLLNCVAIFQQGGTFSSEGLSAKCRYKAEWDHQARDDFELAFAKNEIILIGHKLDENWWIGLKDGIIGLVPSVYLRPTSL